MMTRVVIAITATLASQVPTFHTSTRLVEFNVVVHDKNGPVANLTQGDFSVADRGIRRPISVFFVARSRPKITAAPLPLNTFSNRSQNLASSPSVTIVLLDGLNTLHYVPTFADLQGPTHFENQALGYGKIQLMKFIRDLDPKDRVAIYALGKSLRVLSDFTNDATQLQNVLKEYRESPVTLAELAEPPPAHLGSTPEFDGAHNSSWFHRPPRHSTCRQWCASNRDN